MFRVYSITILLLLFVPGIQAQEYLIESKSATIVYEVPEKTKSDLYQGALYWFENEESTSVYTIESNDPNGGISTDLIKRISSVIEEN